MEAAVAGFLRHTSLSLSWSCELLAALLFDVCSSLLVRLRSELAE
jgi:hypothetical protein